MFTNNETNYESIAMDSFITIRTNDCNSRDKSYEHCRRFFINNCCNPNEYDTMALHLFAYLGSWGMFRNSFIGQKDYLFHKPIIEILCKPDYIELMQWEPLTDLDNESRIIRLMELKKEIINKYQESYYYKDSTSKRFPIKNVTDTLVTKIILGTLGCTPAFDQYLVEAMQDYHPKTFSVEGMKRIIEYAKLHQKEIEEYKEQFFRDERDLYSTMKIVDILLWGKGAQLKKKSTEENQ